MPGPFPGMDPYLEHPARWPGVHQRLITRTADSLAALLPPHYVADIGERVYVVQPERSIYPDVAVFASPIVARPRDRAGGGTALAPSGEAPWVVTAEPAEVREVFVQILWAQDESRVITVIEVLSPANKAAGSEGRKLYLRKQQELLKSETNLVEIDLLR